MPKPKRNGSRKAALPAPWGLAEPFPRGNQDPLSCCEGQNPDFPAPPQEIQIEKASKLWYAFKNLKEASAPRLFRTDRQKMAAAPGGPP